MISQTKYITINEINYEVTIKQISKDKCKCGCGKDKERKNSYFNSTCRKRVSRANQNNTYNEVLKKAI